MQTGFENLIKFRVFEISIIGISIVFAALSVISLFLAVLPKVLALVAPYLPEAADNHHHQSALQRAPSQQHDESDAIVAAIGFALHHQHKS